MKWNIMDKPSVDKDKPSVVVDKPSVDKDKASVDKDKPSVDKQFIVISASETRKAKMHQIFEELNIPENSIVFLPASKPENTREYLRNTMFDEQEQKIICCAKSHCRALEYASHPLAPEFSIIIEDDAAPHRADFLPILDILLNQWKPHWQYVSLGWVPCNPYSHYNVVKKSPTPKLPEPYYLTNGFRNVGLQCYVVKKSMITNVARILNKPTFEEFELSVRTFMANKYGESFAGYSLDAIDCLLNRMMTFELIFPPLVIEQQNANSLLGHENEVHYWSKFFSECGEKRQGYFMQSTE